jgi:hypothetical protein
MSESFNYGTEEEVGDGGGFKNPIEGDHTARIRSIIHCGLTCETFTKGGVTEVKKPAPQVVVIFELKDEEDLEDDGVTPLTVAWAIPLKKGDKASASKFLKAIDPQGKLDGFDDFIGLACQVNCKGSKEKLDDGKPKYINFGGLAGLAGGQTGKFAKMTEDLAVEGVGHISFDDLTEDAILELAPITHVAKYIITGEKYEGSVAEGIIEDIRKENPEYAVAKKKAESKKQEGAQKEVKTNLKEDEEF